MKNNTFEEIWSELKKTKKVLMMLHPRPDGDSLGSCTAMKYVLENQGSKVKIVSKDPLNKNLYGFKFSGEVEFGKNIENENLDNYDHVIILDYSLYEISEDFKEELKKHNVINIDHHKTNNHFGKLNYVDADASSCCSILIDLFKKMKVKFDKELSLRLLLGLCTDTNFFLYGNTVDNLKKATFLIEKGKIDYEKEIYDPIKDNPWSLKKLHGMILSNMKKEIINGKTVAYSYVTKEEYEKEGMNSSDVRLGITCMQDIMDIDIVFVLTELDGEVKGGFRSKELDTTIYSIALNGGGHKKASGFAIKNEGKEKSIKRVLDTIREKGFSWA